MIIANERLDVSQRLPAETVATLEERGVAHGRAEFTPRMIAMLQPSQLGAGSAGAGFSSPKVTYIRELTDKFCRGLFSINEAKSLSDRQLAKYMTSLKVT